MQPSSSRNRHAWHSARSMRRTQRALSSLSLQHHRNEWWLTHALRTGFVVLLHALASVYYAVVVVLHVFVRRAPQATGIVDLVGLDILAFFDYVISMSALLVVVHGAAAIASVVYCCCRRWQPTTAAAPSAAQTVATVRVTGSSSSSSKAPSAQHVKRLPHGSPPALKPPQSLLRSASRLRRLASTLTQWDHALEQRSGVDSYELFVLVEIALQTFQVVKLSRLVATIWINRVVVLVLVVNCWFMPAMHVAFRRRTPTFVKVVHLALDAVLEVVYGMVVPLVIFYPYYRDANAIFYDTPFIGYYDDAWAINTITENRQVFVTSWLDYCGKVAPGWSLAMRLCELQAQSHKYERRMRVDTKRQSSDTKIAPHDLAHRASSSLDAAAASPPPAMRWSKRIVNTVLVVWGLAVLVLHVVATGVGVARHGDTSCLLEIRPLGTIQYACAVLEVSCTQRGTTGVATDLDIALRSVDAQRVQALVFSHCAALAMPPRIKTFPSLVMLKIHNSTIDDWSDDAALTASEHPTMRILYMTLVNLSDVPAGLRSPQFPPTLNDIEICGSNLTALPRDMFTTAWSHMNYFALERSPGVTVFPPALLQALSVQWLSLSTNALTELPDDVFVRQNAFKFFHVSGNPLLTNLPAQVGSVARTTHLSIAHTGIADVPTAWSAAETRTQFEREAVASGFQLTADDSPLCARTVAAASVESESLRLSWLPLQCQSSSAPFYHYPLEHEMRWREGNRN